MTRGTNYFTHSSIRLRKLMSSPILVNNLGPQTSFPVPEGVLNYSGENYLGLTLWAQDATGAKLDGLSLVATALIQSGIQKPALTWSDKWVKRTGAY